jgi:tRNA:m4X modification enzyme
LIFFTFRLDLGRGKEYCGEHSIADDSETADNNRVLCPLDGKHSVDKRNLEKHLKICNSRLPEEVPAYIVTGCNVGGQETFEEEVFRLQDIPKFEMDNIWKTVEELFENNIAGTIDINIKEHSVLAEELANETYGSEKRKHILQTSSIIGIMQAENMLQPKTCFIEYGAGKAAVTFWLASALKDVADTKVLVVDKASHRHKRDNLVQDRDLVERIRADIADLDLKGLDMLGKCESFSGVSKHLCGAATDLTLRCMVQGNQHSVKTNNFIICVCCHHRCSWNTFVGKEWLLANGIDRKAFNVIIKMVSWCICGDGRNRNKRDIVDGKEAERKEKEEIGWKCKRLIDHARLQYLHANNFDAKMNFYAEKSVTLENVCLIGKYRN